MNLRKKGYLFLAFASVAFVATSSLFVYWGISDFGIDTLKGRKEFDWIYNTISSLWGWPGFIGGFPGLGGWLPFMGFKIPLWTAPAITVFGSVLALMNVYELADFHRPLILGTFATSAFVAIGTGMMIMYYGALVPGYSLSLLPPIVGLAIVYYYMRPVVETSH